MAGIVSTIDFDSLGGSGFIPRGPVYSEDGYVVRDLSGGGLFSVGFGSSFNGSFSLTHGFDNGVTQLTKADSTAFDLKTITLSELYNGNPGATVTFTGQRYFGGTVSQSFTLDGGAINRQTFNLSGFTDLSRVTWSQLAPYHQFDNIVVESDANGGVTPAPDRIFAASEFTVRNQGNGDPNGIAITSFTQAQVGNQSGGSSPDLRGMAEFTLQAPELISATAARLVFSTLSPFGSGASFDIVLQAYVANGSADVIDFQNPQIAPNIAIFNTAGLTPGGTLSFDVTSLYNQAIANNSNLGFRLLQLNELSDGRVVGHTFDNFMMELDYSTPTAVPEPASAGLLLIGLLSAGGFYGRRIRRNARAGSEQSMC